MLSLRRGCFRAFLNESLHLSTKLRSIFLVVSHWHSEFDSGERNLINFNDLFFFSSAVRAAEPRIIAFNHHAPQVDREICLLPSSDNCKNTVHCWQQQVFTHQRLATGPALADAGPNVRPKRGAPLSSDFMTSSCSVNRVTIVVERKYAVQH